MKEMKLCILLFSLIFLQCQTKYAIYQRKSNGLNEQLDINFKNSFFSYHADSSFQTYDAKGKFESVGNVLQLMFPENAESVKLSPFKKGYFELIETNENDGIEVEVIYFDVRTNRKLSQSRHFPSTLEILSVRDSSLIRKESYPIIKINPEINSTLIRSKVHGYFDQYILIPNKGTYRLNLFLQPAQTFTSYETTATDCYEVVSGPFLQLRGKGTANKMFESLSVEGESYIPYSQVDVPFLLTRIEKRKFKLFD